MIDENLDWCERFFAGRSFLQTLKAITSDKFGLESVYNFRIYWLNPSDILVMLC